MSQKIKLIAFTILFLFQISFSFYYSSEIINQNQKLNDNLRKKELLEKNNIFLEKEFSTLTSLENLSQFAKNNSLIQTNESN